MLQQFFVPLWNIWYVTQTNKCSKMIKYSSSKMFQKNNEFMMRFNNWQKRMPISPSTESSMLMNVVENREKDTSWKKQSECVPFYTKRNIFRLIFAWILNQKRISGDTIPTYTHATLQLMLPIIPCKNTVDILLSWYTVQSILLHYYCLCPTYLH